MKSFLISVFALVFVLGSSPLSAQEKNKDKKTLDKNVIDKINEALPDKALAQPKQPRRILVFSKTSGFRHGSIPIGIKAMVMMGDKTGAYTALATEDESFFDPDKLNVFDAVVMLNTTSDQRKKLDPFRPNGDNKDEADNREEIRKKSLVDFVSGGKGLIGVHAATDTYHTWKDYNTMMGGAFVAHPWNAGNTVSIKNLDPKNPINAAFDGKGFDIKDEIYVFRADTALPTERRYLLSLDGDKMDLTKGKRADGLYPISWVSTYGKGRTFYCSLGHNNEIYWNPMVLKHYLAGIQYALGDLQADATPIAIPTKNK
jgi:type 1 glutamine amidotransferase